MEEECHVLNFGYSPPSLNLPFPIFVYLLQILIYFSSHVMKRMALQPMGGAQGQAEDVKV